MMQLQQAGTPVFQRVPFYSEIESWKRFLTTRPLNTVIRLKEETKERKRIRVTRDDETMGDSERRRRWRFPLAFLVITSS